MNAPQAEYDLTLDDLLAFYDDALRRAPAARRATRMVMIVTPLMAVLLGLGVAALLGYGFPTTNPFWLMAIGGTAIFTAFLAPSTTHKAQMKQVRKLLQEEGRRKQLGPWRVVLKPDALSATGPEGDALIKWDQIRHIVLTPGHVFFHLDDLTAIIVPRRAFADDAEFERYVEAARLFKRNAPTGVP